MENLIPILTMSSLGLLFGLGLSIASKVFHIEIDPRIERIAHALPGANCGACGMAGCTALAEKIISGEAKITSCAPGGQETYKRIAEILDVEVELKVKRIARVRCDGGKRAKDKFEYFGVKSCAAANLYSNGQKSCRYGCLGFGDCVKACPFEAMYMNENNIPVVISERCTACSKCVTACPKEIIVLEDIMHKAYVKCCSKDKASIVKEVCPVGCIACRICEKVSKGVFVVGENLSHVDYSKATEDTPWQECIEKCPTKCIVEEV